MHDIIRLQIKREVTHLVATTGFCMTSSSLSDDTLSESDPVAKKRDIAATTNLNTPSLVTLNTIQKRENARCYVTEYQLWHQDRGQYSDQ